MNQEEITQQLQAAVALHDQGELDQAEVIYRQLLAIDADNFYALRFLGCLCRLKGAYVEGIELLRKAVSLQPSDVDCLCSLGNILAVSGSHQEAVLTLESCVMLRGDFAQAKVSLGWSLFELGEFKRSEEVLVSAVRNNPALFQAWVNLGNTFKMQEKLEEAIASYRQAIEVKPDFAEAYVNLGIVLKEEGEVEEAMASYRKAIVVKPDFALAHKDLATCLHEESALHDALLLYASALEADDQVSDCRFHLCAAGVEDLAHGFEALHSEVRQLSQCSVDLMQEDLLFLRCISDFSEHRGMRIEFPSDLNQDFSSKDLSPKHSPALGDLFDAYALCRKSALPRWMPFEGCPVALLLLSDYLESLRVKGDLLTKDWMALKDYQLEITFVDAEHFSSPDQLFVKLKKHDESLWLSAERFQFPDTPAALPFAESLLGKGTLSPIFKTDQSEFFRKAHVLDAQRFYMADEDPCLHGVSELYRVHGLIASTIGEMDSLQSVVDLGYYSCGIFNAGLNADLKRYCIEPARHHAVWVAKSGIAEVVLDVPERCVRSFEEYLSRLEAVALGDPGSTAAVISFILQMWEYEQCVEMLQRVKGFASHLVITDDILNAESDESILRLFSSLKPLYLAHNYERMLSDAGWLIEKKWYFHGVRYASGIIVASAA